MSIIALISHPERRRMQNEILRTADKSYTCRFMMILLLYSEKNLVEANKIIGAVSLSIGQWLKFINGANYVDNYRARRRQNGSFSQPPPQTHVKQMQVVLLLLALFSPQDFDYQKSQWSTELLAEQLPL
ncbi:hypothetical protein KKJ09_11015 [Xenorhabdus bovienii]|uniref:hypothetical protein n=1 Tax=Xenorhabdus bovienii TaxID=40576 RepID=UPI0023B2F235|nr:hypothetical protein [Xenorhabdus bovienii]MDE9494108.1 hypothetical protein [Xenorhabdus bovienii]MDE9502645.1 hypothetical protein [Xenorhabdus bovienii]MDE9525342.1 hypothetical protein [Xenorhabdus bovienii]